MKTLKKTELAIILFEDDLHNGTADAKTFKELPGTEKIRYLRQAAGYLRIPTDEWPEQIFTRAYVAASQGM